MRKLIASIENRMREFVEQRDDVAMILGATAEDSLPLLTTLDSVEASHGSDFFWKFTDEFTDEASYAEAVYQSFNAIHQAVVINQKKDALVIWPSIPEPLKSTSTPAHLRLRGLAGFSRKLFPVDNGGVSVWTFFPLKTVDAHAYAALMQKVVEHEFPFPWCYQLRFIIRDDPAEMVLSNLLANAPRIDHFAPDLSREALNESISEEITDETLPLEQRMSSLLMSAGNDFAFGRFPASLSKYSLLLQYHGSMNNYAMGAVALHGMGQAYERMGDDTRAEQSYASALMVSSQGDHPPRQVQLNTVLSYAELRERQQRWCDAERFWDSAQQLATVTRDGPLKARALERRGICQCKQEKYREAEKSWLSSSVIAAQLEESEQCADSLEHLRDLYAANGEVGKEKATVKYLQSFDRV